jgi:hypothetical protein
MGAFKKGCWSSPYAVTNSAPDPDNFKIIEEYTIGDYLVLHVNYPNCTNYEGNKWMVYRTNGRSSQTILKVNQGKLDPHFSVNYYSPIMRVHPRHGVKAIIEAAIFGLTQMDKTNK